MRTGSREGTLPGGPRARHTPCPLIPLCHALLWETPGSRVTSCSRSPCDRRVWCSPLRGFLIQHWLFSQVQGSLRVGKQEEPAGRSYLCNFSNKICSDGENMPSGPEADPGRPHGVQTRNLDMRTVPLGLKTRSRVLKARKLCKQA